MKKPHYGRIFGTLFVLILVICVVIFAVRGLGTKKDKATGSQTSKTEQSVKNSSASQTTTPETDTPIEKTGDELPDSQKTDWELVLVNRENPKDEMNPELIELGNIFVDSRIATAAENFLTAAQEINPSEHFISGYRSVDYQSELYNGYVEEEMAADFSLDREAAEKIVQTYSQPPGMSEHQTGLAIDLSDIDALNESETAKEIAALAPEYGFILRFPEGGTDSTGVGYEDWHFRYVGVENAKYITAHQLTLENYLELLKK
ncbi:M15 family metallopeptidase [Pseudolactococcus hodotermopsidis]